MFRLIFQTCFQLSRQKIQAHLAGSVSAPHCPLSDHCCTAASSQNRLFLVWKTSRKFSKSFRTQSEKWKQTLQNVPGVVDIVQSQQQQQNRWFSHTFEGCFFLLMMPPKKKNFFFFFFFPAKTQTVFAFIRRELSFHFLEPPSASTRPRSSCSLESRPEVRSLSGGNDKLHKTTLVSIRRRLFHPDWDEGKFFFFFFCGCFLLGRNNLESYCLSLSRRLRRKQR